MDAKGVGHVSESIPEVEWVVTPDSFGAAAQRVAGALERTVAAHGCARLAVTGGSAAATLPRVVELLRSRGFDFERLLLTWIDERCVPQSSPESNRGTSGFDAQPGVVLPLFLDDERPADAASRVERELEASFDATLDVVLLGMGGDGHIASLFVGRPQLEGLAAHVDDSPKPPANRITLTRAMLATAQHTILVATGEGKRDALTRVVAGDPTLPVTGLPGLVVCTDLDLEGTQ
jgi:6-phosphogluconolactonase